jgi:outer membrane autotransporter protein
LISPGAYLRVLTTDVTGNFLQTATGVYGLDLDFDPTADRINVTGTASVSGTVNVNIINPGLAQPGSHVVTILSAAGGETHPGLSLTAVPTAVANYGLSYTPTDINLDFAINFAPAGLTINQTAVGSAVNEIQILRNSPAFVPIAAALFYQPTVAALGAVYNSISGEGVSGYEQTAFDANDLFMSTVAQQTDFWLSDPSADASGLTLCDPSILTGPSLPPAQDPNFGEKRPTPRPCQRSWRAWFAGYGGNSRVAGEFPLGSAKFTDNGSGVSAGLDYQLTPDVLVGVAGGAGSSGFNVADRSTNGSLQTGHVALYGAGRAGAFYASGVLAYDFSDVNENRFAMIPGTNATIVPVPGFAEHLIVSLLQRAVRDRMANQFRARESHALRGARVLEPQPARLRGDGEQLPKRDRAFLRRQDGRLLAEFPWSQARERLRFAGQSRPFDLAADLVDA